MDLKAFFKMNYGLYIISSKDGEGAAGCVVNTLTQVTAEPPKVMLAIHKDNRTTQAILNSGVFAATLLTQDAPMELIGRFGFQSSREVDKFQGYEVKEDKNGLPWLTRQMAARFSCRVVDRMDAGTHYLFLAQVEEAETLSQDEPMTYSYYHAVKNGRTPPKASSYQPEEAPKARGWRCKICGYVLDAEELPPDFVCPICKMGAEFFEKL